MSSWNYLCTWRTRLKMRRGVGGGARLHPGPGSKQGQVDAPDRIVPQTSSGLCRTRHVRLRSSGEKASPSPTICSRSDTHSGLLQAFFFSVLGASATCWHPGPQLALAPPAPFSRPDSPHWTAFWITFGTEGPLQPGPGTLLPLKQAPNPGFAAAAFLLLLGRDEPPWPGSKPGQGPRLPSSRSPWAPGREQKISTKGATWASGAVAPQRPPTASCSCRPGTCLPLPLSAQPSSSSPRRGLQAQAEAGGLRLPPRPKSGSLQSWGVLRAPAPWRTGRAREPWPCGGARLASGAWGRRSFLLLRGVQTAPQGASLVKGGLQGHSGCPPQVWKEGGPCPV